MNRRPLTRATALAVLLVAVMTAAFVFVDFSSEAEPTWLETKAAPAFLNAKIRIAAPRREAPIPLTIADVDRGREIYQGACSFCHGDQRGRSGIFAKSFSPRPPQFAVDRVVRPIWMTAYVIRHGVRWTAMPAFPNLPEADAWRVAMYVEYLRAGTSKP